MSKQSIISHYLLESWNSKFFLSYADYELINNWLLHANNDTNFLLLMLEEIITTIRKKYPDSKCSLIYDTPFQLLVATILSAQCTDERVNKVTSAIFPQYPNAESFSKLSAKQIGKLIYSTGFYNNKAKNILQPEQ